MDEKEGIRLAEHIVRNAFGDLVGHVASALLTHGRLSVAEISQHTKLRMHSVHGILLVLIQHNLCWYTKASSAGGLGKEYFEMNQRECLMRLRWGRILDATYEEFGVDGMMIVEAILTHGKLRLEDILALTNAQEEPRRSQVSRLVLNLILASHILPTTPVLQLAPFDQVLDQRSQRERVVPGLKSVRELDTIRAESIDKVKNLRADEKNKSGAIIAVGGGGTKGEERDARGKKRKKGEVDEIKRVNPESHLRIDYDVYNVKLRNKIIEEAAVERWNKVAGSVLKAFLKAGAGGHGGVKKELISDIVSVHSIAVQLSEDEKDSLSFGFGGKVIASRSKIPELLSAYSAVLAGEDNKAHSMGATSEGIFLERKEIGGSMTGGATYAVNFERVCSRLKLKLLEGYVEEVYGQYAVRVFRVVSWGVKALEMTVHQHTMLPKEQIQQILAKLLSAGFVSLQQIPKGNDRTPSRSLFMYYVDLPRSFAYLLSAYYKILANLLHRREAELAQHAALLERANRTDVLNQETLLSERDERDMEELKQRLEKLEAAELRTELAVFVLRDLPGDPPGSTSVDPWS